MKVLAVLGTRPEAIKMAPLITLMRLEPQLEIQVCVTAQHREMLDQVLELFDIIPDWDLNLMRPGQSLTDLTARTLTELNSVLEAASPDLVLVHGDTSTTLAASLASYYHRLPVGHVEAGLRTRDLFSPWPEEANRRMTSVLTRWHFAPTPTARDNLLREGIDPETIYVTGNTVIDALLQVQQKLSDDPHLHLKQAEVFDFLNPSSKVLLVTGHRRENFGSGFERICHALIRLARTVPQLEIIYPVHLNPQVRDSVYEILDNVPNIHLMPPLDYLAFVYLLNRCDLILTDSGGLQEEASLLHKPVLIMREATERPEGLAAGIAQIVGTDPEKIYSQVVRLLTDQDAYLSMIANGSPYGNGNASRMIIEILLKNSR